MLDLESRTDILGITVFRDADDPTRFYHLPGPPKISRDAGGPMFDLFSYRKGGIAGQTLSGGFLTMTVDTGLGDLADRVMARVRGMGGETLGTVPFSSGTVRVIGLDSDTKGGGATGTGPRFVENVLASGTPSLDADNRTIFSMSLSELGAAFFLDVLQGNSNARPIGVVYDLQYVGLLPAYSLDIEIDLKSSYSFLESRFSLGTLFFKTDLDNIVESLKKNQSVVIKETARTLELSTPDAVAERQKNISALVRDLCTGVMFRQTLTPGAPLVSGTLMTAADPSVGIPRPANPATPAGQPPAKPPVTVPAPASPPPPPPAGATPPPTGGAPAAGAGQTGTTTPPALPANPGGAPAAGAPAAGAPAAGQPAAGAPAGQNSSATQSQTPAGQTPAAGQPAAGQPAAGQPAAGQPAAGQPAAGQGQGQGQANVGQGSSSGSSVQELWEKLGRPQAAYALKTVDQEERTVISYKLDQVTAQQHEAAPQGFLQMMCTPSELKNRIHSIELDNPFFTKLNIHVDAADVDFAAEGVNQMTVQVRYGPKNKEKTDWAYDKAVILRTKDDDVDYEFFLDEAQTLSYEYRLIVDYHAGFGVGVRDTHVEGPWTPTELRSLSVHPRWLSVMVPARLQLAPNIPDDVKEVQVQVRYVRTVPPLVDDGTLVVLNPTDREKTVNLRLAQAGDPVSFTSTVFYADGASEVLAAQALPGPQAVDALAVGVPQAGVVAGDVVLIDALGELAKAVVDLQVLQAGKTVQSKSIELAGAGARQPWSVRLPDRDKPAVVRWRQREFYADGGAGEPTEWKEADSPNLVAGIPSEGVLTVTARWVGPAPSAAGLAGVLVELAYKDPGGDKDFDQTESLFFDDTAGTQVQDWKVRLHDRNARGYSYTIKGLPLAGGEVDGPTVNAVSDMLLVRPPAV